MAPADFAAAAAAAAAPKVHLALLAAHLAPHLPVPGSGELDLLLQLEGISLDDNHQMQPQQDAVYRRPNGNAWAYSNGHWWCHRPNGRQTRIPWSPAKDAGQSDLPRTLTAVQRMV